MRQEYVVIIYLKETVKSKSESSILLVNSACFIVFHSCYCLWRAFGCWIVRVMVEWNEVVSNSAVARTQLAPQSSLDANRWVYINNNLDYIKDIDILSIRYVSESLSLSIKLFTKKTLHTLQIKDKEKLIEQSNSNQWRHQHFPLSPSSFQWRSHVVGTLFEILEL